MAILTELLNPTSGTPTSVIAPPRKPSRRVMQIPIPQRTRGTRGPALDNSAVAMQRPEQPVRDPSQPMTGDYLQEQLARFKEKSNLPNLQPGARVKSASQELIDPVNFNSYYQQMNSIIDYGEEATRRAQAMNQYSRMQQLQGLMSQGVQSPGGVNLQGGGGSIPSNPKANFRYAQAIAPKYGWSSQDLAAWYTLGMKESGWNNNAQNPTSTAYGIGQFLDSTWGSYGFKKSSDPRYQVNAMAAYIRSRYGSPSKALAFHRAHNWY